MLLKDKVAVVYGAGGAVGGALGVAIATTVAVATSGRYLAGNEGADPLVVLTEGFQSAFLALVGLAGIGLALALLLLGGPRKAPREQLKAVPAPAQHDQGADRATSHGAVHGQGRSGDDQPTGGVVVIRTGAR